MKKVLKVFASALLCTAVCAAPAAVPTSAKAATTGGPELLRSWTFDSSADSPYTLHGGEEAVGADGSRAIRLRNTGSTADNYIDLGELDLGADSFSITLDFKIPVEQVLKGAYGCILGSQNWSSYTNPGFMIATGSESNDFFGLYTSISSQVNATGAKTTYRIRNMPNTDGEWHSLAIVYNRSGKVQYWLDNYHYTVRDMDISAMNGQPLGVAKLIAGADAALKYPVIDTTLDNIKIYRGRLSKAQIAADALPLVIGREITILENIYDLRKSTGSLTPARAEACEAALRKARADAAAASSAAELEQIVADLRAAQDAVDVTEQPNMKFVVFSDCHVDGGSGAGYPEVDIAKGFFARMLVAIKDKYGDADAVVIPGDFTKNGKEYDFDQFVSLYTAYNPGIDNVMITLGNHEMFNIKTWDLIRDKYMQTVNHPELGFVKPDEVYYDRWVNGYHFINLSIDQGSGQFDANGFEAREKNFAVIGQTQLDWLEEKLAENAQPGKPIFVSLHQPMKGTSPLSDRYSMGEQDAQVKAILKKYPQVVFMSGHLHDGLLGAPAITQNEWGVQYDIPSSWENCLSNQDASFVTCMKVFDDRTEIEVLNYEEKRIMHGKTQVVWHDSLNTQAGGKVIEGITVATSDGAIAELTDGETTLIRREGGLSLDAREAQSLVVTLPDVQQVSALRVYAKGVTAYDVEYSLDGITWKAPLNSRGSWDAQAGWKTATFQPTTAKYVRLIPVAASVEDGKFVTSFAEVIALN